MNTCFRAAALALAALGLTACTGTQQRSDAAFVPPPRSPSLLDEDALYVARVEQIARRRGIEVVWVNAPRKPLAGKPAQ